MKEETAIQHFANSKEFVAHCVYANVKPTRTQASKFLRGKGAAYKLSVCRMPVHVAPHAKHHNEDGTLRY